MPRKPPSEEASATFWLIAPNHVLKTSGVLRGLGIENRRYLSQIVERTLNDVGRLGAGEVLAQRFLNRGSSFLRLEIRNDGLDELARTGIRLAAAKAELLANASLSAPTSRLDPPP